MHLRLAQRPEARLSSALSPDSTESESSGFARRGDMSSGSLTLRSSVTAYGVVQRIGSVAPRAAGGSMFQEPKALTELSSAMTNLGVWAEAPIRAPLTRSAALRRICPPRCDVGAPPSKPKPAPLIPFSPHERRCVTSLWSKAVYVYLTWALVGA